MGVLRVKKTAAAGVVRSGAGGRGEHRDARIKNNLINVKLSKGTTATVQCDASLDQSHLVRKRRRSVSCALAEHTIVQSLGHRHGFGERFYDRGRFVNRSSVAADAGRSYGSLASRVSVAHVRRGAADRSARSRQPNQHHIDRVYQAVQIDPVPPTSTTARSQQRSSVNTEEAGSGQRWQRCGWHRSSQEKPATSVCCTTRRWEGVWSKEDQRCCWNIERGRSQQPVRRKRSAFACFSRTFLITCT